MVIDKEHEFLGPSDDLFVADITKFATKWVHRGLPVVVTEVASNTIDEFYDVSKQAYSAFTDHGVLATLLAYTPSKYVSKAHPCQCSASNAHSP